MTTYDGKSMRQRPAETNDLVERKADVLLTYDLAMMATASRFNLDSKADRTLSNKILTRFFFDLCAICAIDLFVEVGAHEASASQRARAWFKDARVVAFEANPFVYEKFVDRVKASDVEYLNLALAETNSAVTFNLHKDADGSPLANGQASLLKRDKAAEDRQRGFNEVSVEAVRLDDFFAGSNHARAGLWIDVEGATSMVLPGAVELLDRTEVILIEVEDQNYWGDRHWLRSDVVSFLYDQGFIPIARDFEYTHQYNLVLVRESQLHGVTRIRSALARFISSAVLPTAQ